MPRVTPGGSGGPITVLEDDEPYTVTLVDAFTETRPAFGEDAATKSNDTLVATFGISEDPDDTFRVWASIATYANGGVPKNATLGKNKATGKVSQLRAILNAFAGVAEDTEISGFSYPNDTDPDADYEWEYADGTKHTLTLGMKLIVRGTNTVNAEGFDNYKVDKFRSVVKPARAAAAAAKPAAAAAAPPAEKPARGLAGRAAPTNPDDVPF